MSTPQLFLPYYAYSTSRSDAPSTQGSDYGGVAEAARIYPKRSVTLLEGLVGRQETTETRVARTDERTAHLTPQHAHYVREMVDRIVQEVDRRSPGRPLTYAQVYAQVYGRLKHHFRVAKYDQVSDERFEEVQIWLQEEWRRVRGGTLPEQESLF